ncbi:MAG TPA: hypothetical protein VMT53_10805 [Terriglobales bacterium]|nr:hypothetical protein [Terriglobales bacterium]
MILPLNLNRRHKVTLFLTLVLAGIAAVSGTKMMEVVGILLLGLALAWAFGSDSRVVHWLFLSFGVLLACGTVGLAWYVHQRDTNLYAKEVAAFEQRIPELAKEYPLHKSGQIILDKDLEPYLIKNPQKGARGKVPEGSLPEQGVYDLPGGFFRLTMPDGHFRYFARDPDAEYCQKNFFAWGKTQKMWDEAWVAGLDLSEVPSEELPGFSPKPVWLTSDAWGGGVVFGAFLFALGLGLILGIRAKPFPT